MTQFSYGQLEQLWINARGPRSLAPLMAAIAMAESGGRSDAENPSGASGLWQILGAVQSADQPHLFNPAVNAKEAVLKYKTQGLGAWVTYTSGAFHQYYKGSVAPESLPQGGGGPGVVGQVEHAVGSAVGGVFSWPGQITGFFRDADAYLGDVWRAMSAFFSPSTWIRAGAGGMGLVLLLLGLWALSRAVL